jgi:hypothetical protein
MIHAKDVRILIKHGNICLYFIDDNLNTEKIIVPLIIAEKIYQQFGQIILDEHISESKTTRGLGRPCEEFQREEQYGNEKDGRRT